MMRLRCAVVCCVVWWMNACVAAGIFVWVSCQGGEGKHGVEGVVWYARFPFPAAWIGKRRWREYLRNSNYQVA